MDDHKLESRKLKFQLPNLNILESREEKRLSLRKKQIDDLFFNKRQMNKFSVDLEINPFSLDLPKELLEKTCKNEEELIKFLTFLLKSNEIDYVKLGVLYCRRFLSPKEKIKKTPAKLFVENGYLDIFLEHLKNTEDIQIIYELLWCLLNIISVCHVIQNFFYTSKEMIEIYLKCLDNNNMHIIEEVFKIIGNVINDKEESKEIIISSGIFAKIIDISRNNYLSENMIIDVIWISYSLYKKMHSSSSYEVPEEIGLCCLDTFLNYIYYENKEIKIECLNGLSLLAEFASIGIIKKLVEHDVIKMMIYAKSTLDDNNLKLCIFRVIGNLSANSNESVIKNLLNYGLIDFIDFYVLDNNIFVRREIAWIISNLVADTRETLIEVLKREDLIRKIILLIKENEFTAGYSVEAVHSLCNACLGCDIAIFETYFKPFKILESLVFCLSNFSRNIKTLDLIVVTVNHVLIEIGDKKDNNDYKTMFEELGGVSLLENLTNHKNEEISMKTTYLIDKLKKDHMKY